MTTYVFSGVTFDNPGQSAPISQRTYVGTAELRIVASDDYRMRFAMLPPDDSSFKPIDFEPAQGEDYATLLNGTPLGPDTISSVGTVDWSEGSTGMLYLSVGDRASVFAVQGAALNIHNQSDLIAFFSGMTGIRGTISGVASSGEIDLNGMVALTGITENDVLRIQADDDRSVNMGIGHDRVSGSARADLINLGAGNDTGTGGGGDDRLIGGSGRDRLLGGSGADKLKGGYGNDVLLGGAGSDVIHGGGQNDRLSGQSGHDRLIGAAGADVLSGGLGNDTMAGGSGRDTFVFGNANGADRIVGFQAGIDRLNLRAMSKITDLDDLNQNHIRTRDGNVIIDLHDGNSITLVNLTEDQLHQAGYADHFIF